MEYILATKDIGNMFYPVHFLFPMIVSDHVIEILFVPCKKAAKLCNTTLARKTKINNQETVNKANIKIISYVQRKLRKQ